MTPPRVFSWKPSESFQNTKASKILEINILEVNIFNAKGDILLMLHVCFYEVYIS